MSELNVTPEEQVLTVHRTVSRSVVIPMLIDPTLQNEGEAADAKATGDAIAAALTGARVNEKNFDPTTKKITLYGTDIVLDNTENAKTLKQAIEDAGDKSANDIMYDVENLKTVKAAIDDIHTDMDSEISAEEIAEIFAEVFDEEEG